MATRLHIGCGLNAPPGWVNIDRSWSAWLGKHRILKRSLRLARLVPGDLVEWPENVVVHDAAKGLRFADNSVDAIYTSNMLEHFYLEDAKRFLKECYRVLRPAGALRVVVPDLSVILADYGRGKNTCWLTNAATSADLVNERLGMFPASPPASLARRVYYAVSNPFHKWMYDAESLTRCFVEAGFRDVGRRGLFDSRIDRVRDVERAEHFTERKDLCVEGVK